MNSYIYINIIVLSTEKLGESEYSVLHVLHDKLIIL